MLSLLGLGESAGMTFATRAPVEDASRINGVWRVHIGGAEIADITTNLVINAAGIWAMDLSRRIFPGRLVPQTNPVKGSYLRYGGPPLLSTIVYPDLVPGVITERVDATPGIDGALRFGPSVDETESEDDYALPGDLASRLSGLVRRYLPGLDPERLVPDYAGIRPKIKGLGKGASDFMFDWAEEPGWLDLWGLESPGLTSSLAIADYVLHMMEEESAV